MDISSNHTMHGEAIIRLFQTTFAASEGAAEGALIAGLVRDMLAMLGPEDMTVVFAHDGGGVQAAAVFTRLDYREDDRIVFILSPVAVAPDHQGKGLGQALLRHGLNVMREKGVDAVLTYGDITFYAKVGFAQITEDMARAPQPLQYPEGWLAQSLTEAVLTPLRGVPRCVEPLNKPALW